MIRMSVRSRHHSLLFHFPSSYSFPLFISIPPSFPLFLLYLVLSLIPLSLPLSFSSVVTPLSLPRLSSECTRKADFIYVEKGKVLNS